MVFFLLVVGHVVDRYDRRIVASLHPPHAVITVAVAALWMALFPPIARIDALEAEATA